MSQPLIYIILLNYNGAKDTIECLESLKNINYKNYKVIIVDNCSTDNSYDVISKYTANSDYIVIKSDKNGGFAAGNNIGIEYAIKKNAEFVLLLNNDTTVEKDFLNELVEIAIKNEEIAMVGGRIYYFDKKEEIWYAGGYLDKKTSRGKHLIVDNNQIKEVEFITGCMQLISTKAIKEVGLMEEDYFLYYEDVDYCMRFVKKGYKLMYTPKSRIYHKCGASASYVSPTSVYYSNRARWIFINKNFKGIKKMYYKLEIFLELTIKLLLYKGEKREAIKKVFDYIKKGR